jgi:hypothetical protein
MFASGAHRAHDFGTADEAVLLCGAADAVANHGMGVLLAGSKKGKVRRIGTESE